MAKATIRKMKRAEQDYKSLLVWYKETKCKVETVNRELTEAYSKINTFAIIVESEDTLELIATCFRHERMAALECQEENEMARGISSNQKGKKLSLILVM